MSDSMTYLDAREQLRRSSRVLIVLYGMLAAIAVAILLLAWAELPLLQVPNTGAVWILAIGFILISLALGLSKRAKIVSTLLLVSGVMPFAHFFSIYQNGLLGFGAMPIGLLAVAAIASNRLRLPALVLYLLGGTLALLLSGDLDTEATQFAVRIVTVSAVLIYPLSELIRLPKLEPETSHRLIEGTLKLALLILPLTLLISDSVSLVYKVSALGLVALLVGLMHSKRPIDPPNTSIYWFAGLTLLTIQVISVGINGLAPTAYNAGLSLMFFMLLSRTAALFLSFILMLLPTYAAATHGISLADGLIARLTLFGFIFLAGVFYLFGQLQPKSEEQLGTSQTVTIYGLALIIVGALIIWADTAIPSQLHDTLASPYLAQWYLNKVIIWLLVSWVFGLAICQQFMLRRANKALSLSFTKLQQEQDLQQKMFSMINHELRTPASAIHMLTADDEKQFSAEERETIHSITDHLLSVLDNMREVTKPQTAQFEDEETISSLAAIMRSVTSTTQPFCLSNHIKQTLEMSDAAQQPVYIRASAVRKVLINLIKNAAIHSEASQVNVSVELLSETPDNLRYRISIADNGKGISTQDQQTMYGAFSRGQTRAEGSGLGLHISRLIITKQGGELNYKENKPNGSLFEVELLLPKAGEARPETQTSDTEPFKSLTFLLAEDNPTLRLLTKALLERTGASVEVATDGAEALKVWQAQPDVDIVLTDMIMPNMSGYELTAQLRKENFAGLIIGATGATGAEELASLIAAGADAVIEKPLTREKLIETLNQLRAR